MIKKIQNIDDKWFYSSPPLWMRLFLIYVKGDILVLLPFVVAIGFVGFWSVRYMVLLFALYMMFRSLGEIIYWFSQQFYVKQYRPHDFGFKNLTNDAIYILYQLVSLVHVVLSAFLVLWVILWW